MSKYLALLLLITTSLIIQSSESDPCNSQQITDYQKLNTKELSNYTQRGRNNTILILHTKNSKKKYDKKDCLIRTQVFELHNKTYRAIDSVIEDHAQHNHNNSIYCECIAAVFNEEKQKFELINGIIVNTSDQNHCKRLQKILEDKQRKEDLDDYLTANK